MIRIINKQTLVTLGLVAYLGLTLSVYGWRVLWPAIAINRSVPVFYTAVHVQWHTPSQTAYLYDDAWLNAHMARLGFHHPRDIYRPNPPSLQILLLPLLIIPPAWLPVVWNGLSLLALLGGLWLLMVALEQPGVYALWLLPLVLLTQPVLHHFARGQIYLLLFAGLAVTFWGLARQRDGWGGLGLGLILVSKTAAVWLFLLLLLARRWRVVGWAVVTAVPFLLLSLIWSGFPPWLAYFSSLLATTSNPTRLVTAYQTITSLFGHLFIFDATWNPTPIAHLPWLATTLTLLTFISTLYLSLRYGRLDATAAPETRRLTLAMWCALIVSNAPLAEDYHYVLLLPSLATAVWWMTKTGQGGRPLLLALLLLALPLPFKHPLLAQSWLALLAYPRVYGAYLLWGTQLYAVAITGYKVHSSPNRLGG